MLLTAEISDTYNPIPRMGAIFAFWCLALTMVEDSIMREGVPPAWQVCTKAAKPFEELERR